MWPALLVIAASAFAKHYANQQAAKRQEGFRRSMEDYQRGKARETEAEAENLITKQTPKARADELAEVTAGREKSLRDTVGAAQAFDVPGVAGKVSGDYRAAQEAEAGTIAERTRRAITQLASMGAPGEQQQRFGIRLGRAAGTVDAANRASENVGRGYLSDISTVRPNQLLSLAGDVGMTVGGGMAAGEAGARGGAPVAGQGYEDAAGNLYDDGVISPQDARIQRELAVRRAMSLWGHG